MQIVKLLKHESLFDCSGNFPGTFLGVNLDAHAQAAASMSYTIVIAENTMEYNDGYGDRGFDIPAGCPESERVIEAITKASNEIQAAVKYDGCKKIFAMWKTILKALIF